jgi:hypothetical protein
MPKQHTNVAEQERETDATVLDLLKSGEPWPWSVEEVARELGDDIEAVDSLNRLHGAGLIHRLDGFVWPTRAVLMADALQM